MSSTRFHSVASCARNPSSPNHNLQKYQSTHPSHVFTHVSYFKLGTYVLKTRDCTLNSSKLRLACRSESGHVTCWDARSPAQEMATLRCGEEPILNTATQHRCTAQALPSNARKDAVDITVPACEAEDGLGNKRDRADADEENVSPEGKQRDADSTSLSIVAGSAGAQLYWLRISDGGQITISRREDLPEEGVGDVCVRQDGRIVAAGGWDARVRLFHMRTGKRLAVLKQHRASITAVKFDSSGLIACASRDKTVSLWDVYRENK